MATLETRIIELATAVGADVKTLRAKQGDLTQLTTAEKTNIVGAINELQALIANASGIDDTAGDGDTASTWSADKIYDSIEAAKQQVKNDLIAGAGAAFDTLKELADLIAADQSLGSALATEVANRVRFDQAQSLTSAQKLTARTNIGAADAADVSALTAAIGEPDTDFAAVYVAATV